MTSLEIRKHFFSFFIERGHTEVPSSSLIPAQDPTLLFTNAGMNQFKDVFLGKEKRSYSRAVSIQKCMRAGGKHNDLDNVGFTPRHLTFFEMMGNFSFGDYFKKEAVRYAWDFLTKNMSIPADKLYASVYIEDEETYTIWKQDIQLPSDRIYRLGARDNFWQMGDTGPCGPCSEIYLDRGLPHGCKKDSCGPGCDCDRFLEVWNLVFMQYNRLADGTDTELKQRGVDTGMGLERLCSIMQDVDSVFDTDLFIPIIDYIEHETGKKYDTPNLEIKSAFRVLSDHIRAASFAIADGATPSNEGRGYVLRKIIRRAALFADKLTDKNIFPTLLTPLIKVMGPVYPELITHKTMIEELLKSEIERFMHNLGRGKIVFEKYAEEPATKERKQISGTQAFKLYDTFGFPLELTKVLAYEKGFDVDTIGFERAMDTQRLQSGKKETATQEITLDESIKTNFIGYDTLKTDASIIALLINGKMANKVPAHETCWIVTDTSPFFVEKGGQVSDEGTVTIDTFSTPVKKLKYIGNAIAACIKAPKDLVVGTTVTLEVNKRARDDTMKNHTATHLLQAALIELLGKQVRQSGSLVAPDYLRFDFTYHENLTPEQITAVEQRVNEKIMENIPLNIYTTTYKDAINKGVIAIFGEKYNPEDVRVIDVPSFSMELCGGTHVLRTGDIGCFKITEVSALSAGNRRIVAVTGPKAVELFQQKFNEVKTLSHELKVKPGKLLEAIKKQQEQLKEAHTTIKKIKQKHIQTQKANWLQQITMVNDIPFLYLSIPDATHEDLKTIAQELVTTKPGLYFLTTPQKEKFAFFLTASTDLPVDMTKIMTWLREHNFVGGGSKNALQGSTPSVDEALVREFKKFLHN